MTLEGHCDGVNCVSFSPDETLLVSSSSDCSCIIFNIDQASRTKGQRLHKLTFSDGLNDAKNMLMRGCFFSQDGRYVYTMATGIKKSSYIIQWSNKARFTNKDVECQPENMSIVHNNTATGLRVSPNGEQIGILTSDGFIKMLPRKSIGQPGNNFTVSTKRHRLPVTSMAFISDPFNGEPEYIISGSPDFTYNIIKCKQSLFAWLLKWLLFLILMFGALLLLIEYVM